MNSSQNALSLPLGSASRPGLRSPEVLVFGFLRGGRGVWSARAQSWVALVPRSWTGWTTLERVRTFYTFSKDVG